jgi:hypothetical protein
MTKGQIVIAIVLGVFSNLISAVLIEIVKWQLKRLSLTGDLASASARLIYWFYSHLEAILLTGISLDIILLAWVLIKFPTVTVWTVLTIDKKDWVKVHLMCGVKTNVVTAGSGVLVRDVMMRPMLCRGPITEEAEKLRNFLPCQQHTVAPLPNRRAY